MITSVSEWVTYLQTTGGLLGIPLVLAGLILAAAGYRLWQVAVVLSFGVVGAAAGLSLANSNDGAWLYALIGGLVCSVVSGLKTRYSVCVLGGIIGGGLFNYLFAGFGLTDSLVLILTGLGFVVFAALSFLDTRQVTIMVTAFEGAVLFVSGAVAFVAEVPGLFNYFRNMATGSMIFLPFLLLVPTVGGVLLQMADANRKDSGLTGG